MYIIVSEVFYWGWRHGGFHTRREVAALFLQFLEIRYRVQIRDFAGLMDTIGAIVVAAVVLIMGTFGMNGVVYLYVREKFEAVR